MEFNFNEIEEKESGNYIQHGVSKVKVKSVELKEVSGNNYTGDAWDITFEDESGATSSIRVFPFKFNPDYTTKDKSGNQVKQTELDQWKAYQAKIKHLFTKALGEEIFEKTVKAAKDLKTLYKFLGQACAKYGKQFAAMFISDKQGYAKFANWDNSCAAHLMDSEGKDGMEKLKAVYAKNSVKYGPKSAPTTGMESPAASTDLNDLFSQVTTGSFCLANAAGNNEPDSDELPF